MTILSSFTSSMYPNVNSCKGFSDKQKNYIDIQSVLNVYQQQMNGTTFDKQVNIRIATPVFKHLQRLAHAEDLKVSDMIRKAIKQTYGSPKREKAL